VVVSYLEALCTEAGLLALRERRMQVATNTPLLRQNI
jgi:ATP-dependent 26S proteasome regulatory subunit